MSGGRSSTDSPHICFCHRLLFGAEVSLLALPPLKEQTPSPQRSCSRPAFLSESGGGHGPGRRRTGSERAPLLRTRGGWLQLPGGGIPRATLLLLLLSVLSAEPDLTHPPIHSSTHTCYRPPSVKRSILRWHARYRALCIASSPGKVCTKVRAWSLWCC